MPNLAPQDSVLAIDIGGTKILGALVSGATISDPVQISTPEGGDPRDWLSDLLARAPAWQGCYARVGAAVTGLIDDGRWSALNPKTLSIPADYPLVETLQALTGKPALAANDAQAAAWGEFTLGAGQGTQTCVFLTVSTGIGGGAVVNGQLLTGLAGHFGQFHAETPTSAPFESQAAGRWIAEVARAAGHDMDARGVFTAAASGAAWAEEICALSAQRIATACANIQLALAPDCIVIGGSIGLSPGYLDRLITSLSDLPSRQRPGLVAAQLGAQAGIVGVAQLALSSAHREINNRGNDHA